MKILLADDILVNRRKLQNCIKKIIPDAQFIYAINGADAIEQADREQPDIIFLDDLMPDPQGCWACSEIRKNERARPEGAPAFVVTYSSSYVNETYPEGDPRRSIYPEADSFHPKEVIQTELDTLLHKNYPEWKKQTLAKRAAEPTTPAAGAGGGTGEAVPPLEPHDALTTAITGELGRLAMSPPSKPATLAHTAFSGRFSDEGLRRSPSPTKDPSLRHSPSLAAAGHQSFFWRRGDERSLSPSGRRAPRLLDAPTAARLPRSAASSPMLKLFDKKALAAASTGAAAPTASESTPLGGTRVARV